MAPGAAVCNDKQPTVRAKDLPNPVGNQTQVGGLMMVTNGRWADNSLMADLVLTRAGTHTISYPSAPSTRDLDRAPHLNYRSEHQLSFVEQP